MSDEIKSPLTSGKSVAFSCALSNKTLHFRAFLFMGFFFFSMLLSL